MTVTQYVWDQDNILYETDGNDAVNAEYTYSPEQYGELISEYRDGETYTHYYDAQGSTLAMTDETGHVTDRFTFNAWGEEIARTGTTETPWRWVGAVGYCFDASSSYCIRRRYFAPSIARWLSIDPIALSPIFAYSYVSNQPLVAIDPSGLWKMIELSNDDGTPYKGRWRSDSLDDTFDGLVMLVAPKLNRENRSCIIPFSGANASDWKRQSPTFCAIYDAGNLIDSFADGGSVAVSVGRDDPLFSDGVQQYGYIAQATKFTAATHFNTGLDLANHVAAKAGHGTTPLRRLIVVGHGSASIQRLAGMKIKDNGTGIELDDKRGYFALANFEKAAKVGGKGPFSWPGDLESASLGNLPYGCWFRTDAEIWLVGCQSSGFAKGIAANALRGTAAAYGTSTYTWVNAVGTRMSWGKYDGRVRRIVEDPAEGSADTVEKYFEMRKWVKHVAGN
jgi:RHS repeat-associated protein